MKTDNASTAPVHAVVHTPGPWRVADDQDIPSAEEMLIIETVDPDGPHIAFAFNDARGNANLIAAAPELLEACRRLVKSIQDAPKCSPHQMYEVEAALAVVAKVL